jgi:hypothetical protein
MSFGRIPFSPADSQKSVFSPFPKVLKGDTQAKLKNKETSVVFGFVVGNQVQGRGNSWCPGRSDRGGDLFRWMELARSHGHTYTKPRWRLNL